MNRRTFSPKARRDLNNILEYIAAENARAAVAFVDRIEEC